MDGVLNPFEARRRPPGFHEYELFRDEKPVRLSEVHGAWIREAAELFDPVWATGWRGNAPRLIGPILKLPPYPVLSLPPGPFDPAVKLPAVRSFAGDRPLAWVDDFLTEEAMRWAADRVIPTLLVSVDPEVGLTYEAVRELCSWALGLG